MLPPSRRLVWVALVLSALALAALYWQPLRTHFLNDDYLFLEQARGHSLAESLTHLDPLGNYYRPLSRQIYFKLIGAVAGDHPAVFHAVNAALFAGSLALAFDLLLAFLPLAGAMAGTLYFALLPFQRVNLTWVSCSQDLLALLGSLGAFALFRRGRRGWALLAYAAALASKESALPLPVALVCWDLWIEGRDRRDAARRAAPFAALGLIWAAIALAVRSRHAVSPGLQFGVGHLLAGYVHMTQSLFGLEAPSGMMEALLHHLPAIVPLVLLAPLAWWYAASRDAKAATPVAATTRKPSAIRFGVAWMLAFGLMCWPVVSGWSAYYYTLAAVGAALLVGLALARGDRWTWIGLSAFLLWWHAGATQSRAFAVAEQPWVWTSHLTSGYFERGAALTDTLSRQLREIEPAPPRGAAFFFATLPPWAGFQMGNGALIRTLYRDPTLVSHFYSQYSESTAADRPCRFFYWNGVALERLYARARDPLFQVGSDLLLLDRPAGAAHAFRRGLAARGDTLDLLYWLGWAELWQGHRNSAEDAWTTFGAHDDSLRWIAHLRAAHNSMTEDRDTLTARRHLVKAIEFGIGRPEAHAVLGELLMADRPKYGMMELKVAGWLKPNDWLTRRDLLVALVEARLDDSARQELDALEPIYPEWRSDSLVARASATLARRAGPSRGVVQL